MGRRRSGLSLSSAQLDIDSCGCRGGAEFPWDVQAKW